MADQAEPHTDTEVEKGQKQPSGEDQPQVIEMQERTPIELDDYFMGIAFLSGLRSKDPQTQVGACLVNGGDKKGKIEAGKDEAGKNEAAGKDEAGKNEACKNEAVKNPRIVGVGYNGMPNRCSKKLPWNRSANKDDPNTKYLYVCHAEMNAIVNKFETNLQGSTIYVSMHPCNNCAKIIIQSGITEVVYASDKNKGKPDYEAAKKLFEIAKVETRKYEPSNRFMVLDFKSIDLCDHQKDKKKVVTLQNPDEQDDPIPSCEECAKADSVAGVTGSSR